MNWPGVARWGAIVLCVALVVLVSTSEVIARRGWWVFTTELVVPVFLGIAGAAVAVVATLVSHRAAIESRRAAEREAVRVERERRQPLARRTIEHLVDVVRRSGSRTEGRKEAARSDLGALQRELGVHEGGDELYLLAVRFTFAVFAREAKRTASATVRQAAMLQRTGWIRDARALVHAWAQDTADDGAAIRAFATKLPRGVISEKR